MDEYIKVKVGRKWHLCRPTIGQEKSFRSVASLDSEAELDTLLSMRAPKKRPTGPLKVVG